MRDTVGDLDILVDREIGRGGDGAVRLPTRRWRRCWRKGDTRASVLLDVRASRSTCGWSSPDCLVGAALHYFTGSKAHNVAVRTHAPSARG